MVMCHNKTMNNSNCCNRFSEYGSCTPAGLRNVAPSCKDKAVIPSVTVDFPTGIKGLADCFCHVNSNNTTYYIDDKGRVTVVWAGPVEAENYDYERNPLRLRSQYVMDFKKDIMIYFDKQGRYRILDFGYEPGSV